MRSAPSPFLGCLILALFSWLLLLLFPPLFPPVNRFLSRSQLYKVYSYLSMPPACTPSPLGRVGWRLGREDRKFKPNLGTLVRPSQNEIKNKKSGDTAQCESPGFILQYHQNTPKTNRNKILIHAFFALWLTYWMPTSLTVLFSCVINDCKLQNWRQLPSIDSYFWKLEIRLEILVW